MARVGNSVPTGRVPPRAEMLESLHSSASGLPEAKTDPSAPSFCPFCVGLLAFLATDFLELFMHSEYKAISDMRFASIFSQGLACLSALFFVEEAMTLTS